MSYFYNIFSVKIPLEILYWDYAARSRYAECVKKGTQTIHRARTMIVGCAGAGKTTLLKRLQKRSLAELKRVQSTIGLEVHEDVFEILPESDCLKGRTNKRHGYNVITKGILASSIFLKLHISLSTA